MQKDRESVLPMELDDGTRYFIGSISGGAESINGVPNEMTLNIEYEDGKGQIVSYHSLPYIQKNFRMPDETTSNISGRFLCDILQNMRQAYETRNFSYLPGLIEEVQYRAERMENAIEKVGGWGSVRDLELKRIELKSNIRELQQELHDLKKKKEENNGEEEKAND